MGDYLDFARSHYRNELRKVMPDEDSPELLDAMVSDRIDKYNEVIAPLAPRCIGLIDGNHLWQYMTTDLERGFMAAETSTQYTCRKLGIDYLGYSTMLYVDVTVGGDRPFLDRIRLIANHGHGSGGGATAGGDLGSMERKLEPTFVADIYLSAHSHRRFSYMMPQMELDPTGGMFQERSHLLVKAGSFLRGYLPDKETYASRKMLRPLDLGWIEVDISYELKEGGIKRRIETRMAQEVHIHPQLLEPPVQEAPDVRPIRRRRR